MPRVPKVLLILPLMTDHFRDLTYEELERSQGYDLFKKYMKFLLDNTPYIRDNPNIETEWLRNKGVSDRIRKRLRRRAYHYLNDRLVAYYSPFRMYYEWASKAKTMSFAYLGSLQGSEHLIPDIPTKYGSDNETLWWGISPLLRGDLFTTELMRGKFIEYGPSGIIQEAHKHIGSIISHITRTTSLIIAGFYTIAPVIDQRRMQKQDKVVYGVLKLLTSVNKIRRFHPYMVIATYLELIPVLNWFKLPNMLHIIMNKFINLLWILIGLYDRTEFIDSSHRQSLNTYMRRILYVMLYVTPAVTRPFHRKIKELIDVFEERGLLTNSGGTYEPQLIHLLVEGVTWLYLTGEREKARQWWGKVLYYVPHNTPRYISRVHKQAQLLDAILFNRWQDLQNLNKEFLSNPNEVPPAPFITRLISGIIDLIYAYETNDIAMIEKAGERVYRLCKRSEVAPSFGRWVRYIARHGWRATFRSFWEEARNKLIDLYHENPFLLAIEDYIPLEAWLVKKRTGSPVYQILREQSRLSKFDLVRMESVVRSRFIYPEAISEESLNNLNKAIGIIKGTMQNSGRQK